ncbi:mas-related G-protein coupled receptor member X1-like [Octodon degus]|uniref:Mas-related G-protein coupled receptor member X1-like n=1 Tax=Octodon degus TaxID=10160 RepID=A0A6P3VDX1_OCTDE|nr:mas-related G-protein coupled receptor member X1-like [Octodon degus]
MDPTTTPEEMELPIDMGSGTSSFLHCYETLIPDLLIVIIALVGMAGNGVVIHLQGCWMRRNTISVYILNLAASDFLLLCCYFIGSLLVLCLGRTYIYNPAIYANIAIIPYITGLSILSAISIERCLCVLWPIWYRSHRPRYTSAVVCTLFWTLSLFLGILDWYHSDFLDEVSGKSVGWKNVDFIIIAWLTFLFLTLSMSSLALAVKVLHRGSQRKPLTRLYLTILVTVLVFLICGLPFGIYWFLLFWLPVPAHHFLCHPYSVPIVLSCINSCANPIIYFLIGSFRQQHKTLKLALQRALQDSS